MLIFILLYMNFGLLSDHSNNYCYNTLYVVDGWLGGLGGIIPVGLGGEALGGLPFGGRWEPGGQ